MRRLLLIGMFCFFTALLRAQIAVPDTLLLDSLAIVKESVQGRLDSMLIPQHDYRVDAWKGRLILQPGYDWSKIKWKYQTYPFRTWIGQFPPQQQRRDQVIQPAQRQREQFEGGLGGLKTNGFISRGIQLGNNQNLNVQSGMNLQMTGWLSADWQIKAALSDANIPIQPGGTSAKLEDFDQIYIVINNKSNEITGGDFFINSGRSKFVKYNKRAQGIKWNFQKENVQCEVSTSLTKGRFARQLIQGIEGNQGPYRLEGAQGESFIIVLAGTEVVYIDGVKMSRGQDQDYIMDYNSGLLTFMPTRMITKDKRITVEFQYSDKQYIRPLITSQWSQERGDWEIFGGYFNEGDAKNQPLQLNLSDSAKYVLSQAGDEWNAQFIDGSSLAENPVSGLFYEKVDTLGFQNVWVYSTDTAKVLYQVVFSFAGEGLGDYRESGYAAGGKVYEWVAPVWDGAEWIHQGDFIDKSKLTAPNRLQVLNFGVRRKWSTASGQWNYSAEGACSNWDRNTLSNVQDGDNLGWVLQNSWNWKDTSQRFQIGMNYEYQSSRFQRVERFREVEFERNWNILGLDLSGDWHSVNVEAKIKTEQHQFQYQFERLQIGSEWKGSRVRWKGDVLKFKSISWKMDGWYTDTKGVSVSSFLRNKDDVQWKGERWRVFYQDEWERNERVNTVPSKPYAFWDYSVGLGSTDTTKLKWVVFYRNRWDQLPGMNSQDLSTATLAEQWGLEWAVQWNAQTRIMGMLSQRNLMIKDSERFQGNPEKTLLGKVGLSWRDAKGTWSLNTYYQVGSGLEQRKSFVYIEVPLGQGNFVWIDYNDDGIKDLNEFEIPAFGYEANYLRSQVPTSDFVAVGTTQATGSLQWHPQGAVLKNWSNAFNVQSESKRQGSTSYSWSMLDSRDSSVVQSLFLLRDQFQWNAANPRWGASVAGQWNQTKSGLTMGFEWREEKFISPQMRIGGDGPFSVMPSFKRGWKEVASDFLISRNYQMVYDSWWLQMQWKPAKEWLINLQPEWISKKTRSHGDVSIARCAVRSQYQNAQRQNWFAEFGYHQIGYSGNDQGSVYYDLLEGLQTGENFTWSLQWQTMTGKLQWSAIYNGRAAQDQRIIHTGTIQVKAVF